MPYRRNQWIDWRRMLPVDIVLHPSWWFHHEGITFDEDFFFHPARRVEVERKMERALFERWGRFGLGRQHARGPAGRRRGASGRRLADLRDARLPRRVSRGRARRKSIAADVDSLEYRSGRRLRQPGLSPLRRPGRLASQTRFGHVEGDVNWGGVLNAALGSPRRAVPDGPAGEPGRRRAVHLGHRRRDRAVHVRDGPGDGHDVDQRQPQRAPLPQAGVPAQRMLARDDLDRPVRAAL